MFRSSERQKPADTHLASYQLESGTISPGGTLSVREANHSHPYDKGRTYCRR